MAGSELIPETISEKFRQGENVISYVKASRSGCDFFITLVNKNNTNALFCLKVINWPPINITDFTVDNIYPIKRGNFKMESEGDNSIIFSSSNQQSTFYYDLSDIHNVLNFKNDVEQIDQNSIDMDLNFDWLDYYKHEDYSAIDRNIAMGRTKLIERDIRFRQELRRRAPDYTVDKLYTIYIATWNVNVQSPDDINLNEWLNNGEEAPDIYAIAFQELDMSTRAITMAEARPDLKWINKSMSALHGGDVYDELTTVRLVGMMLIVAVKKSLKNIVRYSVQSVKTGVRNMLGNKGGVGISIIINQNHLCFVNSHLAAHTYEIEQRKLDHDEILRRMVFQHGIRRFAIHEHHQIFWFGDLNYRLDESSERIKYLIDSKNYNDLMPFDQLRKQQSLGNIFQGFTEGVITFPPTYKYNPGSNIFDTSEKARAPAYCDRVLWKGSDIIQIEYNNVMQMTLSDHKPVYSIFKTKIPTIDMEKKKKINEEILKTMDKYENDNQPQISVSNTDINFDLIKFNEKSTKELIVANNHHLPVEFGFLTKYQTEDGQNKICDDWLKISPTRGKLLTGQKMRILLEICVGSRNAAFFNETQSSKKSEIDNIPFDILVLHVENGRDTFISIIGEYKPSCFGFPMEDLILLDKPIAQYDSKDLHEMKTVQRRTKSSDFKIPRELFHLVDYLSKNCVETPNLFTIGRDYSKNVNINEIRDWLDNWSTDDYPGTPHTTAEVLLMLIESTPKTLLQNVEKEIHNNHLKFDICLQCILTLDQVKINVFLYICLFLRELRKFYENNKLHDDLVATIFGKVFFKIYDKSRSKVFMINILRNEYFSEFARNHLIDNDNLSSKLTLF